MILNPGISDNSGVNLALSFLQVIFQITRGEIYDNPFSNTAGVVEAG